MLSLKDFKSFEVNNSFKVTGGAQGPTSHTSGSSDMIYAEGGVEKMDIGGDFAGCKCPDRNAYSPACC